MLPLKQEHGHLFVDVLLRDTLPVRIVLPAETRFAEARTFVRRPVLLFDRPMRLPGDGFLGTRFFERFRVILDFRHERLRLSAQPEQE